METVTRSFRIRSEALRLLEEDAELHSTSVNTLLNQIVYAYAKEGPNRYLALMTQLEVSARKETPDGPEQKPRARW